MGRDLLNDPGEQWRGQPGIHLDRAVHPPAGFAALMALQHHLPELALCIRHHRQHLGHTAPARQAKRHHLLEKFLKRPIARAQPGRVMGGL